MEKNLKVFTLKSGKEESCPFRLFLCSIVLEISGNTVREGNIKETFSKEAKVFLFKDIMIVNIRHPKDATKNFPIS